MTASTRLISDILEISRDIKEQRKNSKFKLLGKIVERINVNKLKRRIKILKKKNIILDKFMLQEFFTYLLTTNDGKYRNITKVYFSDDSNCTLTAHILINPYKYINTVSEIRYDITVNNRPGITISYRIIDLLGMVTHSLTYTAIDLRYTDNIDFDFYNPNIYNNNMVMKILNTELLDIIESFLIEQIDQKEVL